jgi:hypothetical protein
MKNTINVLTVRVFGIITLVVIFIFLSVNCFAQSINSPDALKQYLDNQPANSPDKPIKVVMGANDLMLRNIAAVITSSGKYVSIEFTGSALTTIPNNAFVDATTGKGCASLAYIIIPNSVKSIGDYAFAGCTSLFNVTIPNSVTSIGKDAFMNCLNLRSVIMPTRVTSIRSGTFYKCRSLVKITIPVSVTSIESQAFALCDSLASVTFQGKIPSNMFSNNIPRGAIPMYDVFPGDLRTKYLAGGPGTYTRAGGSAERSSGEGGGAYIGSEPPKPFTGTSTWRKQGEGAVEFPVGFLGTWKRDNFNYMLTFSTNIFKASNQINSWFLSSSSGESYTFYADISPSHIGTITIKLVNGNLVISGDEGTDEDNWNGTWKKQ